MKITLMKGKICRAAVTQVDPRDECSVTIDRGLLDAAGFVIYERLQIYNSETGAHYAAYVTDAPRGSRTVELKGAAARVAMPGERITMIAYASFDETEAKSFRPLVVQVDRGNHVLPVSEAQLTGGGDLSAQLDLSAFGG